MSLKKTLTVSAKNEKLDEIIDFISENVQIEGVKPPKKRIMQIQLATEEVFVNIANYAYKDIIGDVTVKVYEEPKSKSVIEFIDNGRPFNPLTMESPDTMIPVEDRDVGGLGIFLVKKMVNEVKYNFLDGKNILKLYI